MQGLSSTQLNNPYGMFVDSNTSFISITDTNNYRIVRWESPSTAVIACGSLGQGDDQFNNPGGIDFDANSSNTFYVPDTYNHRIQMWLLGATNGSTEAGQTDKR